MTDIIDGGKRRRSPKPDWRHSGSRMSEGKMTRIAEQYEAQLQKGKARDDIIEALGRQYDRSTRQIERYISSGRAILVKKKISVEENVEVRHHDKQIFSNSNAIMSEKELGEFLSRLEGVTKSPFPALGYWRAKEFTDFFNIESNKYIDADLRRLCSGVCDYLGKVYDTLGLSDPKGLIKASHATWTQIRTITDHITEQWNNNRARLETTTFERELGKLRKAVQETYSAYRAAVRETLYL